jgi:benzoyl-CoA reductase subunit C
MKALDQFREVVEKRHEYAKKWKSVTGGKVCGCISGNVPEEFIYAAGLLPVRILADPNIKPSLASKHIQANRCAFCRGCLEQGLGGRYDYIDGLVYVQSCLAQSLVFSSWVLHTPPAFYYRMFRPFRRDTSAAKKVYMDLLKDFKMALEKWVEKSISEESLAKSVDTYSENRKLLKQVYGLRKEHSPLIKGSEAQIIVLASMFMDKKEHNSLLVQLLEELQMLQPNRDGRVRVMIVGSGMPPVDFTEWIESIGADVIVEDHCVGLRYFWGDESTEEDPMSAIATYYLERKPQCAYQDWSGEGTLSRISQIAKEFRIEAVIWLAQIFCGTHQWDIVDGIELFEKEGIPVLRLERGRLIPKARFHAQVENFLKKVKAAK